jgi:GntP family gluconate:H+ symporter
MALAEWQLLCAALAGIALSVVLIVKARLHPFIGLLCGALAAGAISGMSTLATLEAVKKGMGDILGGTGLVVALGLSLGAMLQLSNGASDLAKAGLALVGERGAPWACLIVAMVVGLPLFFETGLVLLLPIIAATAHTLAPNPQDSQRRLMLFLPALTGLSVVHALVPPHPGPVLAIGLLGADMGRTMLLGLIVAIPTAILSGPILARVTARGVASQPSIEETTSSSLHPGAWRGLCVILLPIVLIGLGESLGKGPAPALAPFASPVLALLLTNLCALPLLFGRHALKHNLLDQMWEQAMHPAGSILLSIGAGGALKQVLVTAGLADLLAHAAANSPLSPLLLAWGVAVGVRLATGSATVATITAAGVMAKLVANSGIDPAWFVLAIGSGSVFFSHVNDPGFWLVKNYLGVSTSDNFRLWSALETAISVVGIALVLAFSAAYGLAAPFIAK